MSMQPSGSGHPTSGTDLALVALVGAAAAGLVLWSAGAAAILASGHRVPGRRPLAGLEALAHASRPSLAWGAPVGSAAAYWSISGLVVALLGVLVGASVSFVRRYRHRVDEGPDRVEGLAERHEMVRIAGSASLVKRAAQLRPGLARPKVTELGYVLGSARGVACYMSVEDSAVVLGPPRSGKGLHVVIPLILDAPGALVTTSTRPDNLACTVAARATGGRPVALFDPQGLAPGLGSSTRWSPIRGCESPQVAMIRARALCADAGNGTESAPFWSQQTIAAVRCLLHAAALGGREPVDLYAWSLSPAAARDAVSILMSHPGAARAWDEALQAIVSADQRERDSTWAMVANTFAALADPGVLDAVSPGPEEDFDPARFLAERGSLYLLGTASGAGATSGLVGAFVEDIVETARRLAAASPGARLDPPAALVLDEAANYCLPSLGSLMSEGGGTGITTVAVLQSLAQARDRWGRDAAQAIWDSAIVKVVLGGGSNAGDLSDLSRLIGERDAPEHSESWSGSDRRRSVSLSRRQRPILSSDALRRLPFGSALLLLLRNAKPIVLELSPWTGRRDAKLLAAARRQAEDAIRLGSAARIDVRPHRTPAAGRSSPDDDAARAAAPTGARRHASNPKHHRPTRPRSTP